jgi:glycerol-3-phosphate dehydrogenase
VLSAPVNRTDVIGTWAGLRPLLQPTGDLGDAPSKVSREHTVVTPVPGLTVIAGGKLTTYRVMAKDAVDVALGSLARTQPSITHELQIVGAEDYAHASVAIGEYADVVGWDEDLVHRLMQRYGSQVMELVGMCDNDPSLAKPLASAPRRLRVEVAYAVTHEGALDLEDVLRRRTRIDREYPRHGIDVLDEVADLIAPLLGWTAAQRDRSILSYTALAEAEMSAAKVSDDAEASEIMAGVAGPPMWAVPPTPPDPERRSGDD